ncbi:MAG: hypothetical protein JWQ38_1676 [Flavipsychrobacter sp.]|nr:hypothetical protein [Flavipsychrobacter sp.]
MKDNRSDTHVAEKLAKLDTLSAGIVYGKEEAWDKLQARMDKKPARIMPLRYWAAAAAVLLLFAGTILYYYPPVKEVAAVKPDDVINTLPQPSVPQPVAVATPPATAEKMVTIKMRHPAIKNNTAMKQEGPAIAKEQHAPVIPEERTPEIHVVMNIPPPVVIAPMKVIHINELEKGLTGQAKVPVNAATSVVINKLPVLHINEVEREAVEVKEILKNNRVTFGHIPFTKPGYEDNYINTEENYQPLQFLKLRNTQN